MWPAVMYSDTSLAHSWSGDSLLDSRSQPHAANEMRGVVHSVAVVTYSLDDLVSAIHISF